MASSLVCSMLGYALVSLSFSFGTSVSIVPCALGCLWLFAIRAVALVKQVASKRHEIEAARSLQRVKLETSTLSVSLYSESAQKAQVDFRGWW